MSKTMNVTSTSEALASIPDLNLYGNSDTFKLICKASSESEGWMKATKALETRGGCLVQVTTQQRNPDKSYVVAEALCFIPNAKIELGEDGNLCIQ